MSQNDTRKKERKKERKTKIVLPNRMWNKEDFNGSDWEVLAWQKLSKKGNEV